MSSKKTIYLARHAKSSWDSDADNDFDRPLSDKGFHHAKRMGAELNRLSWKPEIIISSPALRASQTCQTYCKQLGFPIAQVEWNKDFYSAYTVTLLHSLTSVNENTRSVMLVGHNPSMEDLLVHLCGETATSKHKQSNGKLFTTGNVMKLSFNGEWKDLVMSDNSLDGILRPKEL